MKTVEYDIEFMGAGNRKVRAASTPFTHPTSPPSLLEQSKGLFLFGELRVVGGYVGLRGKKKMTIVTEYYCIRCNENTAHTEQEFMDAIVIKCFDCGFEVTDSLDDYYDEIECF